MHKTVSHCICACLLVSIVLSGIMNAHAKGNVTTFELQLTPTEDVAMILNLDRAREIIGEVVKFELEDGRGIVNPQVIGTRTDDDDRLFELTAKNQVIPYVRNVLAQVYREQGISELPETTRALVFELTMFKIVETNQVMGASYEGLVRLRARGPGDGATWIAEGSGRANRYGKKFSSENSNEVLSDALISAIDAVYRSYVEHHEKNVQELAGPRAEVAAAGAAVPDEGTTRETLPPEELLDEVLLLVEKDFDHDLLLSFVRSKALTRPLRAADLLAWQEAGIADDVVDAAISLPMGE